MRRKGGLLGLALKPLVKHIKRNIERCPFCRKGFNVLTREKYLCGLCGQVICHDCITKCYCPTCIKLENNNVEVFDSRYKGNKHKPCVDVEQISTNWFERKEDAENELKMRARKNNCDIVYNVECIKGTNPYGNYLYSVWKAEGISSKRI